MKKLMRKKNKCHTHIFLNETFEIKRDFRSSINNRNNVGFYIFVQDKIGFIELQFC